MTYQPQSANNDAGYREVASPETDQRYRARVDALSFAITHCRDNRGDPVATAELFLRFLNGEEPKNV